MNIFSQDKDNVFQIHKNEDASGYTSYVMSADIDLGHSKFSGRNNDLQFLNFSEFIKDCDAFITNRKLCPRLNGTYDSYIEIKGEGNTVSISFRIGSAFCGAGVIHYAIEGGFEFSSDQLVNAVESLIKYA